MLAVPELEHSARTFDEMLPYCGPMIDRAPAGMSYDEALQEFLAANGTTVGVGHRVMFIGGKAAFLLHMLKVDTDRTLQWLRDESPLAFERLDSLTQYYLIEAVTEHISMEFLSLLRIVLAKAMWWRVRLAAIRAMARVAGATEAAHTLHEALLGFVNNMRADEHLHVRDEANFHLVLSCAREPVEQLLSVLRRSPMPSFPRALRELRISLAQRSSEELSGLLAELSDWRWIATAVEALYMRSETTLSLPAYVATLVKRGLIGAVQPRTTSELHHELVSAMFAPMSPQRRGQLFEDLLNRLFAAVGCSVRGPYALAGEQVDGLIQHRGAFYLVEAKWTSAPVSAAPLHAFRGKVEGRIRGTRGVFVSMSGYTANAVKSLEKGRTQSVLLLDGNDVYSFFSHPATFPSMMDAKVEAAAADGRVYSPIALRSALTA